MKKFIASIAFLLTLVLHSACGQQPNSAGPSTGFGGGLAPQGGTITAVIAGTGLSGGGTSGAVTLNVTSGGGGLFGQVMSATPTATSTGLSAWWNQPTSATATNTAVGYSVFTPNQAGNNISARTVAAPSTPYTITILGSITEQANNGAASALVFGYSSGATGSSPTEFIYFWPYAATAGLQVQRYNSATSFNSSIYSTGSGIFGPAISWFQISDDGTHVTYRISQDGVNFSTLVTVLKAGSFLGSGGYTNIIFGCHSSSNDGFATILSWAKT